MTDHKSAADDVIKALRELQEMSEFTPPICHYEKDITEPPFCKPFEQFQNDAKVALALVNRQKAEIERLNTVHADMIESLRLAAEANKDMQAEIKRLTTLAELGNMRANDYRAMRDKAKTARAEAIKEFAERFKEIDVETFEEYDKWGLTYVSEEQIHNAINTLVKEMTEKK